MYREYIGKWTKVRMRLAIILSTRGKDFDFRVVLSLFPYFCIYLLVVFSIVTHI